MNLLSGLLSFCYNRSVETVIFILLGSGALVLLFGLILFILARKKPESLVPLVSFLRRFSWFRKKSDAAALKTLAQDPSILAEAEEISPKEFAVINKALSGGSEKQRLDKLEKIQELAEKGDLQKAAEVLKQKAKTGDEGRAKSKARDARRRKKKAAKKQKRRNR